MARARTGGAGSGYAWALVIFGAGFVISLLLAIVFWAQLGGARQLAAESQARLRQVITANDEQRPEIQTLRTAPGGVVGALLQQNSRLKEIISGAADAPIEEIETQKTNLGVNVALYREIGALRADKEELQRQVTAAQQARDQQQQRAEAALAQQAQLAENYNRSVQGLEAQIGQLQNDLNAFRGGVQVVERNATGQIATERQEWNRRLAELETQLANSRAELDQARRVINELTGGDENLQAKVASPDATITGLLDDSNRVYINRGRNDRVTLGMTFEVFDQGELVQLGDLGAGTGDIRGKATVEVIDVRDTSAVARIVRTQRGQRVQQGDDLINIVYDPNAVYKFHVYGDFDIDQTGEPQPNDLSRVTTMIQSWGGRLTDGLSYDTDFLVLGQEPPLPEALPAGVIDPVRIAENVKARENYERYQQLVGQAQELNIPVLNQNRFLNLVGYYQR